MPNDEISEVKYEDASDPYARLPQTFPHLSGAQIERIKEFGPAEKLKKGTMLFEKGQKNIDFFVVISGTVKVYHQGREGPKTVHTHNANEFTGDVDLFNDRRILVSAVMEEDGEVLRLSRASFRKLISAEPDIGEIIMRAYILAAGRADDP